MQAIRWAISKEVDIITMSFGLDDHDSRSHSAILEAYAKNIIMFAAATNEGVNYDVAYPAKCEQVICVFSTDGLGNASGRNPIPMGSSSHHFATLGEAVKSAWPADLQPEGSKKEMERRMTGTSFATPITAGIAACVLEFACINHMDDETYKTLRCRSGMHKVFAQKLADHKQELHYIHRGSSLEKAAQMWRY